MSKKAHTHTYVLTSAHSHANNDDIMKIIDDYNDDDADEDYDDGDNDADDDVIDDITNDDDVKRNYINADNKIGSITA